MALVLTHRFAADPCEVAPARAELRRWLVDSGVEEDQVDDVVLVFSELAANAVAAAVDQEPPRALIDLTASCGGGSPPTVVLEVIGPGQPFDTTVVDRPLPDPMAEAGRGLAIANALSDHVEAEHRNDITVVRATRLLESDPTPVDGSGPG